MNIVIKPLTGRQSTSLAKPIFHMGASFESDEEPLYESNGVVNNNNNNKGTKDENIPLVARK